jgi:hypothetical protein
MEVKDLRVGNYVHATTAGNQGEGLVVHSIKDGRDIDNVHWYFPIELTEDWLLRFGFEKNITIGGYFFYLNGVRIDLIMGDFKLLGEDKCGLVYVHQLQNLFFAHKGEELIFKN